SRRAVIHAARAAGSRIAAAGTHPFSRWSEQLITPKTRYREIARKLGQVANETVIFGCHVHVGIAERAVAIDVMNRVRARLAPLLALAANSPFWLGQDTDYASYRTEIWSRWPLSGPPLPFASKEAYDALIAGLVGAGMIDDETNLYWDLRPSGRFPTLEFRATDICLTVDEAVMLAGLVRALARTAYLEHERDAPYATVRPELLRAAHWRAARFGLDGELVDLVQGRTVPAKELVEGFLAELRDALEEAGDYDEVAAAVRDVVQGGNGAARQRAAFARSGKLEDVVDYIVAQTERG
ncbi:MAG: glutamate--cysteine ligase, partial [Acidobacteriota bacterium]|nr:glutamate--cysteine ligase [Acidobacteriota bacterium]